MTHYLYLETEHNRVNGVLWGIEEDRVASKSPHFKKLAIFFLCPSKQFLPMLFQIQLLEYFLT
jgi:hypothetical protein